MLLTIFMIHVVGLLSPGPDFFFISRKAASSSVRNGVWASLGIALGIAFWAFIAIFGLAFLSSSAHFVQFVIMILGGSFLAYLGSKMVRVKHNAEMAERQQKNQQTSALQEIKQGLLINIANAKAAVFFSSVLSGYTTQLASLSDSLAVLVMFVVSTFIYFALVALLFSRPAIQKIYIQYSRYIDNFAGVVFIFFGGKLIYSGVMGLL